MLYAKYVWTDVLETWLVDNTEVMSVLLYNASTVTAADFTQEIVLSSDQKTFLSMQWYLQNDIFS